ncbi:MFS transporter [Solimonas marina]|uniref:MFS transporter n=1 Tax=Solimonas marina TaxID=2714601 RepID=A0A969WDA0_9GAMM|nr:MFS transporter [Solimonas marina]NKF24094.1 MFS transporter [Solimonas marina]
MTKRTVRLRNYLAYGANDYLGAGAMAVISTWILFFYTTYCGLSPGEATLIFAIARVLDAITSPLIGHLSDNFYRNRLGRRFGRRRFFLLISIPLSFSFSLMWVGGQHFLYYLCTYVFFEVVYALELIPYETLAAEMSDDYKVRAKFAGSRILFGQSSAILATFLPALLEMFGSKDSAETFFWLGLTFAISFMIIISLVWSFTWERSPEEIDALHDATERPSAVESFKRLYRDLWSTLRIRAFRLHLGMYLGGYISQDIFNAVFTYFVVFALGGATLGSAIASTSGLLTLMYIAQFISVMTFIPLCLRWAPAPSYRVAVSLYVLALFVLLGLYVMHPANPTPWIVVVVLIAGLGRGGLNYIPWSVYNYMADVDEIVTGRRREGTFAGVMTFVRKTAQAIAVLAVGYILQASGFVSGSTTQSTPVLHTIVAIMIGGTLLVLAVGFLISLRFRLDKNTHEVLMGEIARFKRTDAAPVPADRREVVEDLSGWRYEQLWGRNPVGRHD